MGENFSDRYVTALGRLVVLAWLEGVEVNFYDKAIIRNLSCRPLDPGLTEDEFQVIDSYWEKYHEQISFVYDHLPNKPVM